MYKNTMDKEREKMAEAIKIANDKSPLFGNTAINNVETKMPNYYEPTIHTAGSDIQYEPIQVAPTTYKPIDPVYHEHKEEYSDLYEPKTKSYTWKVVVGIIIVAFLAWLVFWH